MEIEKPQAAGVRRKACASRGGFFSDGPRIRKASSDAVVDEDIHPRGCRAYLARWRRWKPLAARRGIPSARARPLEGGEGCRFPVSRPCALVDAAAAQTRDARSSQRSRWRARARRSASTAANATVEVSNATSTSGDLGDPLRRSRGTPRYLVSFARACARRRASSRRARRELATLAATALETYGGAAEVRRGDPTRPTRYRNDPPLTLAAPSPTPRAARHLAAVRAAVTTACGSRAGYVGRRRRPTRIRARARRRRLATRLARRRGPSLPKTVLRLARNLAKLFSWLAEEHDARLSRESGVKSDHLWSLADHLRESDVVLGRFFDAKTRDASVSFSCFRREGYVTRSVVSRGAIALPFDALVRAARAWYVREIERCGLANRERDFERSRTRAVDGSSSSVRASRNSRARRRVPAEYSTNETPRRRRSWPSFARTTRRWTSRSAPPSSERIASPRGNRRDDETRRPTARTTRRPTRTPFRESVSVTETNADSLLPALDPETDERRGGRLATGASTLSFLVGAAEDVVATRGGCAAAVDAPVGSRAPSAPTIASRRRWRGAASTAYRASG